MIFRVQLINLQNKVIKNKTKNETIEFQVTQFLEYDKQTGISTDATQNKWVRAGTDEEIKTFNVLGVLNV